MTRPIALIVDDEEDLLILMRMTLLRMGIDAETAGTIADAQKWLKRQNFDFCLTDLNLPDGSGLTLVSDVVRGAMNKKNATGFIQRSAGEKESPDECTRFTEIVETELMSLHEGNIARYHLRPSEYEIWRQAWRCLANRAGSSFLLR